MQELDDPITLAITRRECSQQLRRITREIQQLVTESYARRETERVQKLHVLDQSTRPIDRQKAIDLRNIKKAEDIKEVFPKLKYVRGSRDKRGITRIEIPVHPDQDPKLCTKWQQLDVPSDILAHLQSRNRVHFSQAQGTPFTVDPLWGHLGFTGNTEEGTNTLSGQYDVRDYDESVRLLLQHLQLSTEMMSTPSFPTISDEDFVQKLKVWSEGTTTSPSGLHLGHYKALIARHSFSTNVPNDKLTADFRAQRDELNRIQAEIRRTHLLLVNYALERGYSYKRWRTVANTILFKDVDNNVKIHRTRVIHIYEADLNLCLGIKWQAAMHQAEDLQLLNEGQHGSRTRQSAYDPVLLEELQCEISRATRKSLVLTNYDAMACYGRIIPSVAMLASRKFGVAASVTQMNANTLQKAEYKIRTEMGLATSGSSHSRDKPVYGTGQGSANSPAIWCFVSSILFDSYESIAHLATYSNPSGDKNLALGMIGFVDDCNGQTNSFHKEETGDTVKGLLQQTSLNAQAWSSLLRASGGALEMSKCSCHVLQWKFAMNGAPVLLPVSKAEQDILTVPDDNQRGKSKKIMVLSPYTAHKTLGHYKEPAGHELTQGMKLRELCERNTRFLWTCPLSRREAWTCYFAYFLLSVCYPLACSSLSKRTLESIQRKSLAILIARCGFNRNTKREIIFGPLELGGANFRHLYH
jgi:hypothetical protein